MDAQRLRMEAETPVAATTRDLAEVAGMLSDAFADDPQMNWFLRPDWRRDAARRVLFSQLVPDGFRHGRIDRPASGGAAAIWMPFEWVRPDPLVVVLAGAIAMAPITGLARASRLVSIRRDMDRHHPRDRRHAYLWFLGVAPAAQGHGIGSALLRAGHARLDAERLPAYLETATARNVALYARHGYRVISEHRARPDAPPMWSMWREPSGD